jgi:hypothetical protein
MRKTDIIFERIIAVFIDWGVLGIREHLPKAYTAYHTVVQIESYNAIVLAKDIQLLTSQIISEEENSQFLNILFR